MGSPDITEMTLVIDWDGPAAQSVRWIDHEGCGGEGPKQTPFTSAADLVAEWVTHCARHDIHPPKPRCGFTVRVPSDFDADEEGPGQARCLLEKHDASTKHKLEI